MRVVVTGGAGVLATALRTVLPDAIYLTREECNIANYVQVRRCFAQHAPQVVIHAAALTNHQHPDPTNVIATNIFGTEHVAKAAKGVGAAMVYLSTHYVYPGDGPYYTEGSRVAPIGTYAWSKLAGERWVKTLFRSQRHAKYAIIRGSWYTRETRLNRWAALGALTDAYVSREPVETAARKVAAIARAVVRGDFEGIINIGGERRTFAQILRDEGYTGFPQLTRADFDARGRAPYLFPRDVSVSTARFDALGLAW